MAKRTGLGIALLIIGLFFLAAFIIGYNSGSVPGVVGLLILLSVFSIPEIIAGSLLVYSGYTIDKNKPKVYKGTFRKRSLISALGFLLVIVGAFFGFGDLLALILHAPGTNPLPGVIIGFVLLPIGIYLMYKPYTWIKNLVAFPDIGKQVFYDDEGLYYDLTGKPYLLKWKEVASYRILSMTTIQDQQSLADRFIPPYALLRKWFEFKAWKDVDPEYATTGVVKLGLLEFIKKDGSSVLLPNVINPYRLIPIFDKYINKENNEKKAYHM
ncbi:DUF1129 domain-containing protein [Saccharolobus shibatae]|nr:DUF1129 domain-containing protein [Saccharolobus shibatae]